MKIVWMILSFSFFFFFFIFQLTVVQYCGDCGKGKAMQLDGIKKLNYDQCEKRSHNIGFIDYHFLNHSVLN